MNDPELAGALRCAMAAARQAGALLRRNLAAPKRINQQARHDIKLELDVRAQRLIERSLRKHFPGIAVLGEEGIVGDPGAAWRWVVDPIDGTVNFTRGLPHACVSIALQAREAKTRHWDGYRTEIGVVYDPFLDEMWAARRGGKARLNNRPITVSTTHQLHRAVITLGFAKTRTTLQRNLQAVVRLCRRVMKIRLMGSAALALAWTAAGRLDAYREDGICLWDIAAGGLILECAGGKFQRVPLRGRYKYRLLASNGRLHRLLAAAV